MLANGVLGEGSSTVHHGYLANIAGLLLLERTTPALRSCESRFTIRGTGLRSTSFGNAAGGRWEGTYRYFIIEDANGDSQIVSLAVLGQMLVRNDPVFGNTNGRTMLVVAVDDFDTRHNSLQLDLDRFVEVEDGVVTVWHDGTLTCGKKGAARRSEVLEFVRRKAPHLMDDDRVQLGSIPADRPARWEDADRLIVNTVEYALVRDAFRAFVAGRTRQ
jgi:hypothetical protein